MVPPLSGSSGQPTAAAGTQQQAAWQAAASSAEGTIGPDGAAPDPGSSLPDPTEYAPTGPAETPAPDGLSQSQTQTNATLAPQPPSEPMPGPVDPPVAAVPDGPPTAIDPALTPPAAEAAPLGPSGSTDAMAPHFFARTEGLGRLLRVEHVTAYRYEKPVERSTHLLRLRPMHDRRQDLLEYDLSVSVDGVRRAYEDVFGNHALRIEIEKPYDQLEFRARSLVRVRNDVPDDLHSPQRRFSIPLVWMPWQRQMMTPYLLPPELPETQLQELIDFAMNFVERQDFDLVQTLVDMNTTIYRDFKYVSGSTTMATTPFNVLTQRQGVCQDFANLLICLARLLSVPARYRVGYIYTGSNYENTMQSDASHAWAELYLPWSGWQGFDPTNGCLVNKDHVRVACGRNYGDATPTSGTIYRGGGPENLSVEVRVEEE